MSWYSVIRLFTESYNIRVNLQLQWQVCTRKKCYSAKRKSYTSLPEETVVIVEGDKN